MKDDGPNGNGKRKASEEPDSPATSKRAKHSQSTEPPETDPPPSAPTPTPAPAAPAATAAATATAAAPARIPFPEKPAVIEERNGEIEFRVVNNDNERESLIILTGLKCIFQKQLPKMPKDYIARLVYDRTHLSIAIVKKPLEVVGGITYRPFKGRQFAEIVFCAISSDQQVKGYGAHLMSHLKDYVKATSDVMHFLTYADNYAIGYFKKQGFTKEITLPRSVWMGYIKDYEGGTIMQCSMLPRIRYLEMGRMLLKQKECVHAKIRAYSKSHIVHQPPRQWRTAGAGAGVTPIDPLSIDAIRASGWSPDMDELARQPRHGPNYNQLLHLLNDLQNHQSAWPFLVPVSKDDVADYYDVIKEPMDLSTMETKLEVDQYPTPEDFIRDAKLIFNNCRKYNNESTPYAKSANKLEKFMWQQIKAIPEWSHLEP
ncbi:histone acetyltransferase GCN5 [Gaeumannomyces tritici R3-111a-1]|uniref:histone acetyltransferase n=1 Tax=Gaeumannomyces tritici (strain R3-111a-1) TaxID=644352 RepID=J3PL02_GAET3|nr:histone acetyltransferase GCN5 [Gaeumannomyces tritici R3-111a-1]EJT68190.1 histone acetyltransferase GCN5 [Gaeumannomyces tritici R3-111a-1]